MYRSDDVEGNTWNQMSDSQHQYGTIQCMTGDPEFTAVSISAPIGEWGAVYGDIQVAVVISDSGAQLQHRRRRVLHRTGCNCNTGPPTHTATPVVTVTPTPTHTATPVVTATPTPTAYRDTGSNCNTYSDSYRDTGCNCNADSDSYRDTGCNCNTDADSYRDTGCNCNTDADSYRDTGCNCNADTATAKPRHQPLRGQ